MDVIPREPRVFIVDDEEPVRRSLGRLLHTAGYEVELLAGAEAYLERAVPARPACLLLDMRMPGMGGMELQHRIAGTALQAPGRRRAARGDRARVEDVGDPPDRDSGLTPPIG